MHHANGLNLCIDLRCIRSNGILLFVLLPIGRLDGRLCMFIMVLAGLLSLKANRKQNRLEGR